MGKRHKKLRGWYSTRKRILEQEPLCRICSSAGFTVGATEVDHITPLSRGGLTEPANLQPLCKQCHQDKTAYENRKFTLEIGKDGWPLDPDPHKTRKRYASARKPAPAS